jgi:hypothetical protein
MPDEPSRGIRPYRGGASNLPAGRGASIGRHSYPVSGAVSAIQGAKPYPANYMPPWMQRRARFFKAQLAAEKAIRVGESVDKPPAEREAILHQGAEKAIRMVAVVIAALLTAVGKARHLLP